MTARKSYQTRPPIMSVKVEDSMDIMIVRDTTRRAAALLGFSPPNRAQLSTASATLAELVLKTGKSHQIQIKGVLNGIKEGIQVSTEAPWLAGVSEANVLVALRSKLGDLVDEIDLISADTPIIVMVMWRSGPAYEDDDV